MFNHIDKNTYIIDSIKGCHLKTTTYGSVLTVHAGEEDFHSPRRALLPHVFLKTSMKVAPLWKRKFNVNTLTTRPGKNAESEGSCETDSSGKATAGSTRPTLNQLTIEFRFRVESVYAQRMKVRPKALKRRIHHLIELIFPPRPRSAGRPRRPSITTALEMYRQQRKHGEVNWVSIAKISIPGFKKIKSFYRCRIGIRRLQDAVYKRERRNKRYKNRSNSSDR